MDNLTHTLFAATLSQTPLSRAGRGTTAVLILASNAPDIDIVAAAGGALSYLEWHRGPTHGPLGIVGLGLTAAGLVWATQRALARRTGRAATPFGPLAMVSIAGVLLHVLMDLPTSYGSRLFSPFDWRWYAVDWVPIVDIYLLVILVAGLVSGPLMAAWRPGQGHGRRLGAAAALVLMAAHYGLRGWSHHQALAAAPGAFGPTLPHRCDGAAPPDGFLDRWPRPAPAPPVPGSGPCLIEIAAIPAFLSPFDWRLIAHLSSAYETREIDVFAPAVAVESSGVPIQRLPNYWTPAVAAAARTRVGCVFLDFSRFPAAHSSVDEAGVATVRWTDVRFLEAPRRSDGPPAARSTLFMATVRVGPDGSIVEQRLGP
jgi:membrane-bound metal-dependent hydrolase YbcI (DUF457 family)